MRTPGAGRGLCLPAVDPSTYTQSYCPSVRHCPNLKKDLGNIFSVLILYFPFPLGNIKHNCALSLSLRLWFVDVSTWKFDPFASNREPSLDRLWRPLLHWRLQSFCENERERERLDHSNTVIKARRVPARTPQSFQTPFLYASRSKCVFDVCLVVGLFV